MTTSSREGTGLHLGQLLARVLAALAGDVHQQLADLGYGDVSPAHGANVFQFLGINDECRLADLTRKARISRQAMSQVVSFLASHGYLTVSADPSHGRAKLVRLTEKGRQARLISAPLFAEQEARWAARLGAERFHTLRATLEAMLSQLETAPAVPCRPARRQSGAGREPGGGASRRRGSPRSRAAPRTARRRAASREADPPATSDSEPRDR